MYIINTFIYVYIYVTNLCLFIYYIHNMYYYMYICIYNYIHIIMYNYITADGDCSHELKDACSLEDKL